MDETDAMRYFNREDYRHALEIYLEMLEEAERNGDRERIAYNANLAGLCLYFLHMHSEAREYFNKALENVSSEDEVKVRKNIEEMDRFIERIERDIEEIENRLSEEDDEVNRGILLSNLGILKYLLGKNNEAEDCFKEALSIFRKQGDKIALAAIYTNFAMLYDDLKKLDYLYLALDIFSEEGHVKGQADVYHALALYYLHNEELEESYYFLKKEIELLDKVEDTEMKKRAYELAADVAMELGKVDEGLKFTEKASEV